MAHLPIGLVILFGVYCIAVGVLLLIAAIVSRTPEPETRRLTGGRAAANSNAPNPRQTRRAA